MVERKPTSVVVTGYGAVTPFGVGVSALEDGLFSGRPAIRPITGFDARHLAVRIAGEVPDFIASDFMDRRTSRRMDRFAQFAVAASREAVGHARLPATDPGRIAVVIHTGAGGIPALTEAVMTVRASGPGQSPPLVITRYPPHMASAQVALELGIRGPALTGTGACASGTIAMIEAMQVIQRGDADVVIAGGAEACVTELGIAGFDNLGVLSHRNNDPGGANRPFSADRTGTVLAEGACVLILESEEHAVRRGASVYARISSGAITSDAYHLTAPDPSGTWVARAIEQALERADLDRWDIGLISMHATASQAGDIVEAAALHRAFGDRASQIPVTATKSMVGHMIGGAGALSTLGIVLGFGRDEISPTINLTAMDPEIDLNVITEVGFESRARHALAIGLGFGGQNAVLVVSRPD